MAIQTINPSTGKIEKTFDEFSKNKAAGIIEKAYEEFLQWKTIDFSSRKILMKSAAGLLRENKNKYAKILTLEMGKPIIQAVAEVEKCAWVCDYYAENAEIMLDSETVSTDASESYIRFDPLGVVLAVF